MSKSIYKEALDLIENIDRNLPYTWLVGRDNLMKIKQTLEQAQKQEKLLEQIKNIINMPYNPYIMPMLEKPERYNEIVKQIKELDYGTEVEITEAEYDELHKKYADYKENYSLAEKMFEVIGFRKKVYGDKINYRRKTTEGSTTYYEEIEFNTHFGYYETYFHHNEIVESMVIHMDTQRAINQQLKELKLEYD